MNHLSDLLEVSIRQYPEKVALIDEKSEITYSALGKRINRLANGLAARGIQKGDRVAIMMSSRIEMIEIYFTLFRLGAVALPINAMFQSGEISYICQDTEPRAFLAEDTLIDRFLPLQEQFLGIKLVATVGKNTRNTIPYESLLEGQSDRFVAVECDPEDLSALFYTSGTTGFPKGAMFTHWITTNMSKGWLYLYHFQPEDRVFVASPTFYTMGFLSTLAPTLEIGATGILPSRFQAGPALEMMSKYGATAITAVPSAYLQMLEHYDQARHELQLRICMLSGSVPPESLITRLHETFPGAAIMEVYGATEAFLIACTGMNVIRKPRAAGIPGSNLEVKIVDEDGNELPRGSRGEIICRGCTVTQGYWRKPEATDKAYRDGWFHTGDIGVMDEDGYISVVDRKKDVIIAGGHSIYPVEVENLIHAHPGVLHAVVVGVPDEVKGELPVAAIVMKKGQEKNEQMLIDFCRDTMAHFKAPRRVFFVDELPMTSTGKILRRRVREQILARVEETSS